MCKSNYANVKTKGLRGFVGHRWVPCLKASDAELCFFYLRLNKRLSKQSWGWWFETPSHPLWRHCYDLGSAKHPLKQSHPPQNQYIRLAVGCYGNSWIIRTKRRETYCLFPSSRQDDSGSECSDSGVPWYLNKSLRQYNSLSLYSHHCWVVYRQIFKQVG